MRTKAQWFEAGFGLGICTGVCLAAGLLAALKGDYSGCIGWFAGLGFLVLVIVGAKHLVIPKEEARHD